MGSFAAEDIHIPSVYVNRIVKGGSYEKRIEVKTKSTEFTCILYIQMDNSLNSIQMLPFPLINYRVSPCFQKRTVKKSQQAQPKPKKDSDVVRERIIRRAALEFQDGMYGILLKKKQAPNQISIIPLPRITKTGQDRQERCALSCSHFHMNNSIWMR